MNNKSGLLHVFFCHLDLVIPCVAIHKRKESIANSLSHQDFHVWDKKVVLTPGLV